MLNTAQLFSAFFLANTLISPGGLHTPPTHQDTQTYQPTPQNLTTAFLCALKSTSELTRWLGSQNSPPRGMKGGIRKHQKTPLQNRRSPRGCAVRSLIDRKTPPRRGKPFLPLRGRLFQPASGASASDGFFF